VRHTHRIGAGLRLAPILLSLLLAACGKTPTVTLALLGDVNLGRGVVPTPESFAYLSPWLDSADLALANLESPLANYPPSGAGEDYNLCVLGPQTSLLSGWGLDLLAIANNHRYDCGPAGPFETTSLLANAGLGAVGPGMDPVTREVNGLPLAFLAFDDVSAPLDAGAAVDAIRSARQAGSLVIVSVHWGMEYQGGPSERQQDLARQFAAAGAALLWGHHPHVLQPVAWIDSTLVAYSLGNALFDQAGLADTRRSALLLVTLDENGVTGVQAVPFEIDLQASRLAAPEADSQRLIFERLELP
jgi:poly-gamma-glutamate synthesis protein (capsule biosynthesis protein)